VTEKAENTLPLNYFKIHFLLVAQSSVSKYF